MAYYYRGRFHLLGNLKGIGRGTKGVWAVTTGKFERVVEQVVQRAQLQGYVVPFEIREQLLRAGLSDTLWEEVVAKSSPALEHRSGRYYHPAQVGDWSRRLRSEKDTIRRNVRRLLRQNHGATAGVERRGNDRRGFAHRVTIRTQDGVEFTQLSRDLSNTGIRLIGTRRLLGQKVRVSIPPANQTGEPFHFVVRILWTCAVADDLYENGGPFLSVDDEALCQ